jgi:hypothetical protein
MLPLLSKPISEFSAAAYLSPAVGDDAVGKVRLHAVSPTMQKEESSSRDHTQGKQRPTAGRNTRASSRAKFLSSSKNTNQLTFVENKGQFDNRVKFQVSNAGRALWLTQSGIVFDFQRCKSSKDASSDVEAAKSDASLHVQRRITKSAPKKLADCGMER